MTESLATDTVLRQQETDPVQQQSMLFSILNQFLRSWQQEAEKASLLSPRDVSDADSNSKDRRVIATVLKQVESCDVHAHTGSRKSASRERERERA